MTAACNICGNDEWGDMGSRRNVRCVTCNSLERTRVMKLFLDRHRSRSNVTRVLHFAPEKGLFEHVSGLDLVEYRVADFMPQNFKFTEVERFDLCTDCRDLPSDTYDVIMHAHIMEHVPCNVTAVLSHLHRALAPGGVHLMCIPFMNGGSEEDLGELSREDATRRFGQGDHVRKFGRLDMGRTLGMVFRIRDPFSLLDYFSADELDRCNIPERERTGYTGTSVFPLTKADYLLAQS